MCPEQIAKQHLANKLACWAENMGGNGAVFFILFMIHRVAFVKFSLDSFAKSSNFLLYNGCRRKKIT